MKMSSSGCHILCGLRQAEVSLEPHAHWFFYANATPVTGIREQRQPIGIHKGEVTWLGPDPNGLQAFAT